MYKIEKMPVIAPEIEVRLRCLEAAVQAFTPIAANGMKHVSDASYDVLRLADQYFEWILKREDTQP